MKLKSYIVLKFISQKFSQYTKLDNYADVRKATRFISNSFFTKLFNMVQKQIDISSGYPL